MSNTTVHFALDFELELTSEDLLSLLMRREMAAHPPLAAKVEALDVDTGVGGALARSAEPPPPPAPAEPVAAAPVAAEPAPAEPAPAEPVAAEPAKPATPRSHRAKAVAETTNGKTPAVLAPTVAIPQEGELRALLSKLNAVHPAKIAGVIAILEQHGGHKRLNDCPADTWPAIWAAAEAYVTAASV